jgi:hypothetical protein
MRLRFIRILRSPCTQVEQSGAGPIGQNSHSSGAPARTGVSDSGLEKLGAAVALPIF